MIRFEHQLHDRAEMHDGMLISSDSHKLIYILRKAKQDRTSVGFAFKKRGQIQQAVELPIKDAKILAEELKDILDIYF